MRSRIFYLYSQKGPARESQLLIFFTNVNHILKNIVTLPQQILQKAIFRMRTFLFRGSKGHRVAPARRAWRLPQEDSPSQDSPARASVATGRRQGRSSLLGAGGVSDIDVVRGVAEAGGQRGDVSAAFGLGHVAWLHHLGGHGLGHVGDGLHAVGVGEDAGREGEHASVVGNEAAGEGVGAGGVGEGHDGSAGRAQETQSKNSLREGGGEGLGLNVSLRKVSSHWLDTERD